VSGIRRLRLLIVLAALPGASATGQDRRAGFRVSAVVTPGCTVSSDAAGSWGRIDLGSVPGMTGSAASGVLMSGGVAGIVVGCTPDIAAALTADAGENASGAQRRMRQPGGAGTIPYQLRVGEGAAAWNLQSIPLAFPAGMSRRTLPISATTVLAAPVAAGAYADTVRLTLTF